jgi:putative ABC transport system ATP-binding protein
MVLGGGLIRRGPDLKIELKGVSRSYGRGEAKIFALRYVNLKVREGDYITVTGPSGSGKSTLLYVLGLLEKPSAGSVSYDGKDMTRCSDSKMSSIRLKRIGFVFQQFYLLPNLTAIENVMVPLREAGNRRAGSRKRAMDLLESLSISRRANHLPGRMSGGEQQKVAIARALANDPEMVLADEPTGELDSENTGRIMDIMTGLNRDRGKTLFVVSHDPEVSRRGKRVLKMKDGRIQGS